jgi:hypothetical protein
MLGGPIETFKIWYDSLPRTHRYEIARFVGEACPGFASLLHEKNPHQTLVLFNKLIDDHSHGYYKHIGTALVLRSSVQFFLINKRRDKTAWLTTKAIYDELAKILDSHDFTQMACEVAFQSKQWAVTCAKWNVLINQSLSDEQLDLFALNMAIA